MPTFLLIVGLMSGHADTPEAELTAQGLQHVTALDLSNVQITEAVLQHLKGHTSLQVLRLDGTSITDAGLAELNGLTKLQALYLINTRITGAGIERLRSDLPKCNIGM